MNREFYIDAAHIRRRGCGQHKHNFSIGEFELTSVLGSVQFMAWSISRVMTKVRDGKAQFNGDPKRLNIIGAKLGDEWFATEKLCWNVTRALRQCETGKFGPPQPLSISEVLERVANIRYQEDRVRHFMERPDILSKPVLHIEHDNNLKLIDGVHRLHAAASCGYTTVMSWVIPSDAVMSFRVRFVRGDGVEIDPRTVGAGKVPIQSPEGEHRPVDEACFGNRVAEEK